MLKCVLALFAVDYTRAWEAHIHTRCSRVNCAAAAAVKTVSEFLTFDIKTAAAAAHVGVVQLMYTSRRLVAAERAVLRCPH